MVAGTVAVNVVRAFALRDAALLVTQKVSVLVNCGAQSDTTGDGSGINPVFPEAASSFVWPCNDEQELSFLVTAKLPIRSDEQLGTAKIRIAEAAKGCEHGPLMVTLRNAKGQEQGELLVMVEFTPAHMMTTEQRAHSPDPEFVMHLTQPAPPKHTQLPPQQQHHHHAAAQAASAAPAAPLQPAPATAVHAAVQPAGAVPAVVLQAALQPLPTHAPAAAAAQPVVYMAGPSGQPVMVHQHQAGQPVIVQQAGGQPVVYMAQPGQPVVVVQQQAPPPLQQQQQQPQMGAGGSGVVRGMLLGAMIANRRGPTVVVRRRR